MNITENWAPSAPEFLTSSSLTFTEGTEVQGDIAIQPMITKETGHLILSKIVFFPALAVLLLSSFLLLFVILKHFRHLIHLYLSLVFLVFTEVNLFANVTIFSVVALINPGLVKNLCNIMDTLQLAAAILPGYGVLIVSLARFICVKYPLKYKKILNIRAQCVVMVGVVSFVSVIVCLPLTGVCSYTWNEGDTTITAGFCSVGPAEQQGCMFFYWIAIGLGFVLPFLGVTVIYSFIVKALIDHRKTEKRLGKSNGRKEPQTKTEYKSLGVSEKLQELGRISQDRIPWSIVLITILHILATIPWIPQIVKPELSYDYDVISHTYVLGDVMFTVMLIAISLSPGAYIVTTQSMRRVVYEMCCCERRPKQGSQLSSGTKTTVNSAV